MENRSLLGATATTFKGTLVIVDRDIEFVKILQNHLLIKGHEVHVFTAFQEIWESVNWLLPHLILCDINIIEQQTQGGLKQIEQKLKKFKSELVLMSQKGTMPDIQYAMKIGADDCLSRSLSPEMMVVAIEARLQRIYI